jgi:integrase
LALLIACRTAMRAKEVLQVCKGAFRHGGAVLLVSHKMQYKTGKMREVPLGKRAQRVLRPFVKADRVFSISAETRDKLTRDIIDRLGFEDLRFHDSRATALTHMSRRVNVMTLVKISGHSDVNTLMHRYYRESAAAIASRLD